MDNNNTQSNRMSSLMEALQTATPLPTTTTATTTDNAKLNFLSALNHNALINNNNTTHYGFMNNNLQQQRQGSMSNENHPSISVPSINLDAIKLNELFQSRQQQKSLSMSDSDLTQIMKMNLRHVDDTTTETSDRLIKRKNTKINNNVAKKKTKMLMPTLPAMTNNDYTQHQQQMSVMKERFDTPPTPSAMKERFEPAQAQSASNQSPTSAPYIINLPPNQTLPIPLKKRSKLSVGGGSSVCSSRSASSSIFSSSQNRKQPFATHIMNHRNMPPNKIELNRKNEAEVDKNKSKKSSASATSSRTTRDSTSESISTGVLNAAPASASVKNNKLSKGKVSTAINHYKSECNNILKRCLTLAEYNTNEDSKGEDDMVLFYFAARAIYDDIQRWKRLKDFFIQCQEMKDMVALKEQNAENNNEALFSDDTTKASTTTTSISTSNQDMLQTHNNDVNVLTASNVRYPTFPNPTSNNNPNNTPLHLLSSLLSSTHHSNSNDNISNQDNRSHDLSSINNDTVTTKSHSTKNETINSEFTKQLEEIDTVSEISNFDTISELESKNSFLGRFRNVTSSVHDNKSTDGSKSGDSKNKSLI